METELINREDDLRKRIGELGEPDALELTWASGERVRVRLPFSGDYIEAPVGPAAETGRYFFFDDNGETHEDARFMAAADLVANAPDVEVESDEYKRLLGTRMRDTLLGEILNIVQGKRTSPSALSKSMIGEILNADPDLIEKVSCSASAAIRAKIESGQADAKFVRTILLPGDADEEVTDE